MSDIWPKGGTNREWLRTKSNIALLPMERRGCCYYTGFILLSRDVTWGVGNFPIPMAILTRFLKVFGLTFGVRCFGLEASNVERCHGEQGTFNYILVNGPELQSLGKVAWKGIGEQAGSLKGA